MAQAEGIARHRLIQFSAGRPAPLTHQRFVATEGLEPIAGRRFASGDTQIGQQIGNRPAAHQRNAGGYRSALHEMEMAIDKAGRDRSPAEANQMSARTDQPFEAGEGPMGENSLAGDRKGIATRMAEYGA